VELLHELLPSATLIVVLVNLTNPTIGEVTDFVKNAC